MHLTVSSKGSKTGKKQGGTGRKSFCATPMSKLRDSGMAKHKEREYLKKQKK